MKMFGKKCISLSKTEDVTKIKGWKKKTFITNLNNLNNENCCRKEFSKGCVSVNQNLDQFPEPFDSEKELKITLNVDHDSSDNCNTNNLKEDFLPPDVDIESLKEEIIVSSDVEENSVDPIDIENKGSHEKCKHSDKHVFEPTGVKKYFCFIQKVIKDFKSAGNIISVQEYINGLFNENSNTHLFGLLCLTDGLGYLPVNHFSSIKLSVKDPLFDDIYHQFNDLKDANTWLNGFFKSTILFEDLNVNLKWVIIKPKLMAKMRLFDKNILLHGSKAVNKNGVLMDKKQFTAEYLRASKNLRLQRRHKAGQERISSLLEIDMVKCLLRNRLQENNVKRINNEHSYDSEADVTPFVPSYPVIIYADFQHLKNKVIKTKKAARKLGTDTVLKSEADVTPFVPWYPVIIYADFQHLKNKVIKTKKAARKLGTDTVLKR